MADEPKVITFKSLGGSTIAYERGSMNRYLFCSWFWGIHTGPKVMVAHMGENACGVWRSIAVEELPEPIQREYALYVLGGAA